MGIEFAFELSGDVKQTSAPLFVKKAYSFLATLGFDTFLRTYTTSPLVIEQL